MARTYGFGVGKQRARTYEFDVGDVERTFGDPQWDQLRLLAPIDLLSIDYIRRYLQDFERPPESPQFTPRGLRVSLFAKRVGSFMIAWTFCIQNREGGLYAVCIRVVGEIRSGDIKNHDFRGATSGRVFNVSVDRWGLLT